MTMTSAAPTIIISTEQAKPWTHSYSTCWPHPLHFPVEPQPEHIEHDVWSWDGKKYYWQTPAPGRPSKFMMERDFLAHFWQEHGNAAVPGEGDRIELRGEESRGTYGLGFATLAGQRVTSEYTDATRMETRWQIVLQLIDSVIVASLRRSGITFPPSSASR